MRFRATTPSRDRSSGCRCCSSSRSTPGGAGAASARPAPPARGGPLLASYLSLGPELTVYGHRLVPLPTPFGHDTLDLPGVGSKYLPLLDNTLPERFALYSALAVSVIAALWLAGRPTRDPLAAGLALLAVVVLLPNPEAGVWSTGYHVPAFFTDAAYRACLSPGEIVLPQPIDGQFTLWQVSDGFRFRLAGGRLQTSPPSVFLHPAAIAQISVGYPPVRDQARLLRAYVAKEGVGAAILDERQASTWGPSLSRVAPGRRLGGITLYRFSSAASPGCPAA